MRFKQKVSALLVVAVGVGFGVYIFSKSAQRHEAFNSLMDLAIFEQVLWNTASGRIFESSLGQVDRFHQNFLGDHQSYILLLLAPVYALVPFTQTLLALQALAASAAGWILYLLARSRLQSPLNALAVSFAFYGYSILHQALLFDFHPLIFTIPFWLLAMYGIETKKYRLYITGIVLAFMSKEEVALTGLAFSLYLLTVREHRKYAIATMGIALAFLVLNFYIVGPYYSPEGKSIHLLRFAEYGSTKSEIALTLLSDPDRNLINLFDQRALDFIERLLNPVLFLALLSASIVTVMPYVTYSLMSDVPAQISLFNQYPAVAIGPIFYSIVLALSHVERFTLACANRFRNRATTRRLILLVAMVPSLWLIYRAADRTHRYGALSGRYHFAEENFRPNSPKAAAFRAELSKIPADASIIAENNLLPHLAQRRLLEIWPRNRNWNFDYVILIEHKNLADLGADFFKGYRVMKSKGLIVASLKPPESK
jgi:uncharacterized membrane protein